MLAKLLIRRATPEDMLPANTIRFYCPACDDSMLHERVVRDYYDRSKFIKAKRNHKCPLNNKYGKGYWKCQGCGKINRF